MPCMPLLLSRLGLSSEGISVDLFERLSLFPPCILTTSMAVGSLDVSWSRRAALTCLSEVLGGRQRHHPVTVVFSFSWTI